MAGMGRARLRRAVRSAAGCAPLLLVRRRNAAVGARAAKSISSDTRGTKAVLARDHWSSRERVKRDHSFRDARMKSVPLKKSRIPSVVGDCPSSQEVARFAPPASASAACRGSCPLAQRSPSLARGGFPGGPESITVQLAYHHG